MMRLISRYLSNNIDSIDVEPITTVLEEYARIANGGELEFIKSQKSGGERPNNSYCNVGNREMLKARISKKDLSLCCHTRGIAAQYALIMNAEVRRSSRGRG
jgi:hypothetical protein